MTSRVAVSDEGYPVFIDRVDGPGSVRFHAPLGQREVPYASAAGKAILRPWTSRRCAAVRRDRPAAPDRAHHHRHRLAARRPGRGPPARVRRRRRGGRRGHLLRGRRVLRPRRRLRGRRQRDRDQGRPARLAGRGAGPDRAALRRPGRRSLGGSGTPTSRRDRGDLVARRWQATASGRATWWATGARPWWCSTPGEVASSSADAPVPGPGELLDQAGAGRAVRHRPGDRRRADRPRLHPLPAGPRARMVGTGVSADGRRWTGDPGGREGDPVRALRTLPRGETNLCETYDEIGFTRDGAAARHVAVPGAAGAPLGARRSAPRTPCWSSRPPWSTGRWPGRRSAGLPRAGHRGRHRGAARGAAARLWSPGEIVMLGRREGQAGLAATAGAARFETTPAAAGTGYDLVIEAAGTTDAVLTALARGAARRHRGADRAAAARGHRGGGRRRPGTGCSGSTPTRQCTSTSDPSSSRSSTGTSEDRARGRRRGTSAASCRFSGRMPRMTVAAPGSAPARGCSAQRPLRGTVSRCAPNTTCGPAVGRARAVASSRFISGEPRRLATKRFAGCS